MVLVLEDKAYGMIRWKQATDGFADFGMTFENPDFPAYAAAFGAKGSRVATAEGLAPALETAFRESGVQLVVAPIDYSENTRVLIDELRRAAKASIRLRLRTNTARDSHADRTSTCPPSKSVTIPPLGRCITFVPGAGIGVAPPKHAVNSASTRRIHSWISSSSSGFPLRSRLGTGIATR